MFYGINSTPCAQSVSINLNSKETHGYPNTSDVYPARSSDRFCSGKIITILQSLGSILQVKERGVKRMSYSVQQLRIIPSWEWAYHLKTLVLYQKPKKRMILAVFHHYLKMDQCMQTLIKRQKSWTSFFHLFSVTKNQQFLESLIPDIAPITDGVKKLLDNLDSHKASGSDNIPI